MSWDVGASRVEFHRAPADLVQTAAVVAADVGAVTGGCDAQGRVEGSA